MISRPIRFFIRRPSAVFGVLVVALFAYEGWTLSNEAPGDTISEIVWGWTDGAYGVLIAWAFGVLNGHWFWPRVVVDRDLDYKAAEAIAAEYEDLHSEE